jgi:hypothetical protein
MVKGKTILLNEISEGRFVLRDCPKMGKERIRRSSLRKYRVSSREGIQ